jgi:acetyltransferase-like isoleucine patch superfamily enzyme
MPDLFISIFNRWRALQISLVTDVTTLITRISCALRGIRVGKGTKFIGLPVILNVKQSVIRIGAGCRFHSMTSSNLIGVNHRCIVATHTGQARILIGDRCGFSGTVIGAFTEVTIGNGVKCGANTLITDSDWHPEDPRAGLSRPVRIGDNVWLGYGVIVMKGVTIGENALIGAGSVVTTDIPANTVAGGNPCRIIKSLDS